MDDPVSEFRAEVERFLKAAAMAPTTFGSTLASDPQFVFELRDGREPRFATMRAVRERMRDQRPDLYPPTNRKRVAA